VRVEPPLLWVCWLDHAHCASDLGAGGREADWRWLRQRVRSGLIRFRHGRASRRLCANDDAYDLSLSVIRFVAVVGDVKRAVGPERHTRGEHQTSYDRSGRSVRVHATYFAAEWNIAQPHRIELCRELKDEHGAIWRERDVDRSREVAYGAFSDCSIRCHA